MNFFFFLIWSVVFHPIKVSSSISRFFLSTKNLSLLPSVFYYLTEDLTPLFINGWILNLQWFLNGVFTFISITFDVIIKEQRYYSTVFKLPYLLGLNIRMLKYLVFGLQSGRHNIGTTTVPT